jgi:membrane-bound lytic murein transglycosylase D
MENGERAQDLLDTALDLAQTSQDFWSTGELDRAIETLDQAYIFVMNADTENHPDLIQQKEDLRFMISKRILEIYASRYTAVDGNHNAIPLTMNKHVENEIKLFQGRERKFFLASYNRSGKYREKIVASLKQAGLPEELSWLPLIESGFKVKALSRARALGLWQFIPSTGYKFGLKRDTWIDERLDPEKSTAAAIDYLEELHNIFGDWTTVLAGYNCGEGRVLRVIRDQKINYLDNFWDLYEKLPRETARYVPRFLATLHILSDPEKYGFQFEEPDEPLPYRPPTPSKSRRARGKLCLRNSIRFLNGASRKVPMFTIG